MTPYQQAMEFFGERAQSVAGSVIVRVENKNVLVVDAAGEFTEEGRDLLMGGAEAPKRRGRPPKAAPKLDTLGADVFVDTTAGGDDSE